MNSQVIGVLTAAAQDGDATSLQTGSWVAGNATSYNRLLHSAEKKALTEEADALEKQGKPNSDMSWADLLLLAANAQVDAVENARLNALLASFPPGSPELQNFVDDISFATASIQRLASQNIALTWTDGKTIVANGAEVYAFQSTTSQKYDHDLFNASSMASSIDANFVPAAWKKQFGEDNAAIYVREIAGVSSSQSEFDDLIQRVSSVLGGGIERVTWDLDLVLAATGAPAVLRALVARRLGAEGEAKILDLATTGIEWGNGLQRQGIPWENYPANELPLGSRLPPNFETFDFYDPSTGTAISAKTLNTTTASRLENPSRVYSSLKGNIDAASRFETYTLGGVPLDSSMIATRELRVAIPYSTTFTQWSQIGRAVEYGQSQGVKVIISPVK